MIPYEELASALAQWRGRNGLPTGAAEYLGEMAPMAPMSFEGYAPVAAAPAPVAEPAIEDLPFDEPEPPLEEIDLASDLDYVEEVQADISEFVEPQEAAAAAELPEYDAESQFVDDYLQEYAPEPAAEAAEALDPSVFGTQQVWGGNLGAEDPTDPPSEPPKGGRKKTKKR